MSKFTITVEADSLPELADRVLSLAGQLNSSTASIAALDAVMPEVKAAAKRASKTKEAQATEGEPTVGQPDTAAATSEATTGGTTTSHASAEKADGEKAAPQKEPEVKQAEAAAEEQRSIRELTLELVGKGKRDKVEAILAEFGLQKTTAVEEAREDEMRTALIDALAA